MLRRCVQVFTDEDCEGAFVRQGASTWFGCESESTEWLAFGISPIDDDVQAVRFFEGVCERVCVRFDTNERKVRFGCTVRREKYSSLKTRAFLP